MSLGWLVIVELIPIEDVGLLLLLERPHLHGHVDVHRLFLIAGIGLIFLNVRIFNKASRLNLQLWRQINMIQMHLSHRTMLQRGVVKRGSTSSLLCWTWAAGAQWHVRGVFHSAGLTMILYHCLLCRPTLQASLLQQRASIVSYIWHILRSLGSLVGFSLNVYYTPRCLLPQFYFLFLRPAYFDGFIWYLFLDKIELRRIFGQILIAWWNISF